MKREQKVPDWPGLDSDAKSFPLPGTFAQQAVDYLLQLRAPDYLPQAVEVVNPYLRPPVQEVVLRFFAKYFNDVQPRVFLLGINPGRFGGGITGVSFTDPFALRQHCGIPNEFGNTPELSSRFVYALIDRMGGPESFYSRFFLSSLYPLALIRQGKNYNFYDHSDLYAALQPLIVQNVRTQLNWGGNRQHAICLGRKNGDYLKKLNKDHRFFEQITVLDHPRYVMQYKLRHLDAYLDQYQNVLNEIIHSGQ
jgi:hypothetical protein